MPTIVPNTLEKFMLDSEMYEQWASIINDHKLKHGDPSNINIKPALTQINGPDFSKCPSPLRAEIELQKL